MKEIFYKWIVMNMPLGRCLKSHCAVVSQPVDHARYRNSLPPTMVEQSYMFEPSDPAAVD